MVSEALLGGSRNYFKHILTSNSRPFDKCITSVFFVTSSRLRLKCDGTRAETRFGLSAKRMSPFKSAGASVQSTTGSRGVRISGSNAGYTMFRGRVQDYWLPTPFASFPFTSPPVRHRVPSLFNWTVTLNQCRLDRHVTKNEKNHWLLGLPAYQKNYRIS